LRFAFRRDIALGRYVPLDTPVHRLDPRTKLLLFLAVLVALFGTDLVGDAVLAAVLGGAAAVAHLPARRVVAGFRALAWIFALTFLFQLLWAGPTRLGGLGPGALVGLQMVVRLAGMLVAAYLLTFTTEPIRLADGLARLFGFLERWRVPVRDLAMVLTLALRFLPTVMEEAQRIVLAQQARGARFEGGPLARARRLLPLAVPLFAGCLHRADVLAMAMEARGYRGSQERTQMDPVAFAGRDAVALGGAAAGIALLLRFRGG
jgi:energy-coupling factor transport system permease protein